MGFPIVVLSIIFPYLFVACDEFEPDADDLQDAFIPNLSFSDYITYLDLGSNRLVISGTVKNNDGTKLTAPYNVESQLYTTKTGTIKLSENYA